MQKESVLSKLIESYLSDEVFNDMYERAEESLREINHPLLDSSELYNTSITELKRALSPDKVDIVSRIEDLSEKCCKYAMCFSFKRGVYAAFQRFHIRDLTYNPFDCLVAEKLFELNDANNQEDFCDMEKEMINLCLKMETEDICAEYKDFFHNVFDYHDDMTLSIAAIAFLEGINHGAAFLREIFPNEETLNCMPSSVEDLHILYSGETTK